MYFYNASDYETIILFGMGSNLMGNFKNFESVAVHISYFVFSFFSDFFYILGIFCKQFEDNRYCSRSCFVSSNEEYEQLKRYFIKYLCKLFDMPGIWQIELTWAIISFSLIPLIWGSIIEIQCIEGFNKQSKHFQPRPGRCRFFAF